MRYASCAATICAANVRASRTCPRISVSESRNADDAGCQSGDWRSRVEPADYGTNQGPLEEFAGGQLRGELAADVDGGVVDGDERADHEDSEKKPEARAIGGAEAGRVKPGVDGSEDQDGDEEARQRERCVGARVIASAIDADRVREIVFGDPQAVNEKAINEKGDGRRDCGKSHSSVVHVRTLWNWRIPATPSRNLTRIWRIRESARAWHALVDRRSNLPSEWCRKRRARTRRDGQCRGRRCRPPCGARRNGE